MSDWDQWERELCGGYEYFVIGTTAIAKIYVSRDGVMPRTDMSAQLRRLADYLDRLPDEQARR